MNKLQFRDLEPGDVFRDLDTSTLLMKCVEVNSVNVETGEMVRTSEVAEVRRMRVNYTEEAQ